MAPVELFVDTSRPRGRTRALYEQLRDAILSGRVAPGERLPASRDLAHQLGVSRHTVTTVYGRLTAEGFLEGRTGGGTVVSATLAGHAPASRPAALTARPFTPPDVAEPPPPGGCDLRMGRPDPRLFPLVAWRRCVVTALQQPPQGGTGPAAGSPDLRRALARWVARSRGVDADPADLVVTSGAQHAVDLAARALLQPGDTVAMEDPGYAPIRHQFRTLGLRVEPVPVDDEGLVVDAVPPHARLVYVTPSHQSPTGVTMSLPRRRALLAFADRAGVAVIEDDYDSEFRHSARPLEPLYRLDRAGRVLYVGTFSKTLAPSLKVGLLVLPPGLAPAVAALIDATGTQVALTTQLAMHRFVVDGMLDRHLRRARRIYAERHAVVAEFAAEAVADGLLTHAPTSHSGLHVTARLPDRVAAADVLARARAGGVALTPLADAWAGTAAWQPLVLGFGCADRSELARGLPIVRSALAG